MVDFNHPNLNWWVDLTGFQRLNHQQYLRLSPFEVKKAWGFTPSLQIGEAKFCEVLSRPLEAGVGLGQIRHKTPQKICSDLFCSFVSFVICQWGLALVKIDKYPTKSFSLDFHNCSYTNMFEVLNAVWLFKVPPCLLDISHGSVMINSDVT